MKKILIVCSTHFYDKIDEIKKELEKRFEVYLPNGYGNENDGKNYEEMTNEEYCDFFKSQFLESREKVSKIDCVLVLNYEKNGKPNYIGASTFLEMYEAYMNDKTIYIMNDLPNNLLHDEMKGFNPIIINNDLSKIE